MPDDPIERNRQLYAALTGANYRSPPSWGLTRSQETILGMLVANKVATREAIMTVLFGLRSDPPNDRAVDCHVTGLKRKLRPGGYQIKTASGIGWYLPDDMRARLLAEFKRAVW